ncbi:hypothetical protein BGX27_007233 [Mortierella sp. AM989]|nr:hypothetical protein BGX27_007233 [Mortierella sp. AM989]
MECSDAEDRVNLSVLTQNLSTTTPSDTTTPEQNSQGLHSPVTNFTQVEGKVPTFTQNHDSQHQLALVSSTFSSNDIPSSALNIPNYPLSDPPAYTKLHTSQHDLTLSRVNTYTPSSVSLVPELGTVLQDEIVGQSSSRATPAQIRNNSEPVHPGQSRQPHVPLPTSAPISVPVYRRLFPEDDELPGYIPISENSLAFKLLASQCTTYTVIPSQGPSEFREQVTTPRGHASNRGERLACINNGTGLDASQQQFFPQELDQRQSDGIPVERNQRQAGVWTLEYWDNDTIAYLCYLMDPNFPRTTEYISNSPTGDDTNLANATFSPRGGDIELGPMTSHQIAHERVEARTADGEEMERVRTEHIRGRPPPLNRNRDVVPRHFSVNDTVLHNLGPESLVVDQAANETSASTPAVIPILSSPSTPAPTLYATPITPLGAGENNSEVEESASNVRLEEEELQGASSIAPQRAAVGTLPSVQHVQVNDGYLGEVEDTVLAHTMDIQATRRDTIVNMGIGEFNNALPPEFFKRPSFAFVSAEDPQTWIWWSAHHELSLQECRQESRNDVVAMWWRIRQDYSSPENKERRKREKIVRKQTKAKSKEDIGLWDRWHSFLKYPSALSSYRSQMEIFMRLRGVHYAWREEDYESRKNTLHQSQSSHEEDPSGDAPYSIAPFSSTVPSYCSRNTMPRVFTLVRDASFVMGQQSESCPVAEVWIEGEIKASASLVGSEVALDTQLNSQPSRASVSGMQSTSQVDTGPSSSFPVGLRKRRCVIRVTQGLHTELETFALSTGPRLVEYFDLYTEESVPGPSRASFYCGLVTFSLLFLVTFIGTAYTRR